MGSGHGERRARRRQSRAQRKQRRGGFSDDGGGYGSKDGAAGAAAEEHDRYKLYERFRDDSHVGRRLVEDGYKSPVNGVATRVTVQGTRAGECKLTRDVPSNSRCAWRRRSQLRRRRWGMSHGGALHGSRARARLVRARQTAAQPRGQGVAAPDGGDATYPRGAVQQQRGGRSRATISGNSGNPFTAPPYTAPPPPPPITPGHPAHFGASE